MLTTIRCLIYTVGKCLIAIIVGFIACLRWYEDDLRLQKMGKKQSIYLVFGMVLLILLPHFINWLKVLNGLPTSEAKLNTTVLLIVLLIMGWSLGLIVKGYFDNRIKAYRRNISFCKKSWGREISVNAVNE